MSNKSERLYRVLGALGAFAGGVLEASASAHDMPAARAWIAHDVKMRQQALSLRAAARDAQLAVIGGRATARNRMQQVRGLEEASRLAARAHACDPTIVGADVAANLHAASRAVLLWSGVGVVTGVKVVDIS